MNCLASPNNRTFTHRHTRRWVIDGDMLLLPFFDEELACSGCCLPLLSTRAAGVTSCLAAGREASPSDVLTTLLIPCQYTPLRSCMA